MRLIDADDFVKRLEHVPLVQEAIRKAFDQMPSIDAVEVVRCRECKWCDVSTNVCHCPNCGADMRGDTDG